MADDFCFFPLFFHDGNGLHLLFFEGSVRAEVCCNACNAVENVKSVGKLTECGILTVKVRRVVMHDEELRACGVGALGTGHGQNTALVLQVVLDAVVEELALDAVAGATHASAFGAAALDHKTGDDSVEDQAVIVVMIAQIDEIINALGCDLRIQLTFDDAAVFHGDLKSRICHC